MLELLEGGDSAAVYGYVAVRAGIVTACWLFVVVACLVDFWSGVRTAKALGEALLSNGFRKTVVKVGDYARVLLFALMIDATGSLLSFYKLPFASMVCVLCVLLIEGKSVIENSRRARMGAGGIPTVAAEVVKLLSGKGKDVQDAVEKALRALEDAKRKADGKGEEKGCGGAEGGGK